MKKTILAFVALAMLATAVQAQSLSENSYYQKSVELENAARIAFDEGDYDAAADYAAQAQENARLSDEFVAKILARKAADTAIASAQTRYDWATSVRAATRFPSDYAAATTELDAAKAAYSAEAYAEAIDRASTVDARLSGVTSEELFPAYYVVREELIDTDCLWRIAALPFVYNDPLQWPVLYKANKKSLPQPSNPDLILPGMKLAIPPLSGEQREGVWTEGLLYPTYSAIK